MCCCQQQQHQDTLLLCLVCLMQTFEYIICQQLWVTLHILLHCRVLGDMLLCCVCRIDTDWVADATVRGGRARFINHSCDPNCYTKIFTIDGQRKIGIYAKKSIEAGHELFYDYKVSQCAQVDVHLICCSEICLVVGQQQ